MKKLTSILLALMTMTTVSCTSKNSSTAPESSIAETMGATQTAFYETRIPLEYTVERPVKLAMAGDDCYFFYISKRDIHCAVINGENQVVSDSVLGSVFNADMGVSPMVNEDGSYSVIYPISDFPFEFNDYGEVTNYGDFIINGDFSFVMAKFDSSGNKLSETEIVGMRKTYEKTQSHLGNICPYNNGLLLCVGNGLILLDDEGNIIDSAHFDQQSYDIGCDCEGNVIISGVFNCAMMDGSTLELPEILMDDPMELNSIEGAPSMGMGDYSYYLVYSDGIYGIDADGDGYLEFAFSPSFVDYMEVAKCYVPRSCDEFFSAAVYSNEVLLYTRRPADYSSERIELDLWQINGGSSCEFVTAFNKLNDRYTVKVSGDRLCEEDLTKALLVDEGPDMILFSGNYVIDDLVNLGALADMNKLMDEYDGITRDELLPNVLRAYDKNGSIYALPDTFSISVMAANKEVIPRDMIDWTYDDLIEAFERQPEGTNLFNDVHEGIFNALVSDNLELVDTISTT